MEIIVNVSKTDKVMLRSGTDCFELCKMQAVKDKDSGEVSHTWRPEKYFSNLAAVFDAILRRKVLQSDAASLLELRDDLARFRQELLSVYSTDVAS